MDLFALKPYFFFYEMNDISWWREVAGDFFEISSIGAIVSYGKRTEQSIKGFVVAMMSRYDELIDVRVD